jgi:hypothetical protein
MGRPKFNADNYSHRKVSTFDQALAIVAEERGWVDRRVEANRKPSMPKLKFMEAPPPELYAGDDWRERVEAWKAARSTASQSQ